MGESRLYTCSLALAAGVALLLLLAAARAARARAGPGARARFFTSAAAEEPTRSYVPYTGTVPFGLWGATPWADAVPPY